MASGYRNRYEPEPQPLQVPGFTQKPSCHLLFETSMSTEQLCCDMAPGLEQGPGLGHSGLWPLPTGRLCPMNCSSVCVHPSPSEPCWPRANLPRTAAASLQMCTAAGSQITHTGFKCQMCLLLRDRTNADHSLYLVPRTHWAWCPHVFATHLLVHPETVSHPQEYRNTSGDTWKPC